MAANTIVDFEILIDDSIINILTDKSLSPVERKHVLSLVNDFQDGQWRFGKFQDFIWDNIAETALSYSERQALIDKSHSSLTEAAKKLRLTDSEKNETGKGSELAEIVLYGLMKHHYKALPIVPKIFYKQNAQDNAKGADSVHIVIESEQDFSIWFGEAKFYNSIEDDRLSSIIESVEHSLQSEKLAKENSIITNVADLDSFLAGNTELCAKIKAFLSPRSSIDLIKPKLHIPILLLHECKITSSHDSISAEYKDQVIGFHKNRCESYFKKQINKISHTIFKYSEIHFHLIFFPVPSKQPIVDKFVSNVTHYKNQ
jgi:hypothetical protein